MVLTKQQRSAAAKKAAATRKRRKTAAKAKRTRERESKGHNPIKQEIKREVFEHYSKGKPKCNCCGEDASIDFLCIDHIVGRKDKTGKIDNRRGDAMYRYLRTNNYPKGYQVLCWNCNSTKFVYTVCPHKRKRTPSVFTTKYGTYKQRKHSMAKRRRR